MLQSIIRSQPILFLGLCLLSTGCFERKIDPREAQERAALQAAIAVEDARPPIVGYGPSTDVLPIGDTTQHWKPIFEEVCFYYLHVVPKTQLAIATTDDHRYAIRDAHGWSALAEMPGDSNLVALLAVDGKPFPIFFGGSEGGLIRHANGINLSEAMHVRSGDGASRGLACADGSTIAVQFYHDSVGFMSVSADGTAFLYSERVSGHLQSAVGDGWLVHVGGPYEWTYRIISKSRKASKVITASVRPRIAKRAARMNGVSMASPQLSSFRDQIVTLEVDAAAATIRATYDPNRDPEARIVSVDQSVVLWAYPLPVGAKLIVSDPALGPVQVEHLAGSSIARSTSIVGLVGDSVVNTATTTLIAAGPSGLYESPLVAPRSPQ